MRLLLCLLLLSTPTWAQYAHRSNPGTEAAVGTFFSSAGSGHCPGTGCVNLDASGTSAALFVVAGTYLATGEFRGSNDDFGTSQLLVGYPLTNGVAGTAVSTLAANATGTWWVPTLGFKRIAFYANAYTSNTGPATVKIDADPSGLTPPGVPLGSVGIKSTTTATAPVNTTLTAATATLVRSSSASICQTTCQDIDAVIHVKCGQDNTVSATVGQDVAPGQAYQTSSWYGGTIYCFPASGTPAVSCQSTVCP